MEKFNMEFWKEFFDALYPEYYYENLKSPFPLIDLNFILIGLYIGIILGSIIMWYRKGHMGRAVRAIIAKEAYSEENAATLEELGIAKKRGLVRALRKNKFGGLVKRAESTGDPTESDKTAEKYYIPEEFRYQAEERYSRRGIGIGIIIFWAIVLIPVFMVFRFIIPELLQMLDNFITTVK